MHVGVFASHTCLQSTLVGVVSLEKGAKLKLLSCAKLVYAVVSEKMARRVPLRNTNALASSASLA